MNRADQPLVSVVTPVYNGQAYLRECIESVIGQTYLNWEYIILNNASTDGTLAIAEEYARKDSRIRVHSNDRLLPIIANHNKAFSLISAQSRYCKVVSADDWIFPEFLERAVSVAEANPTVGVVGSYQLSGGGDEWYVRTDGLSYHRTVVPGPAISRLQLLGKLSVFGNPTSNFYRSDLVRATETFYPNETAEADLSGCFSALLQSDFGFVHQVLSYERLHRNRITTTSLNQNAYLSSSINDLLAYGPSCMNQGEVQKRLEELLDEYYALLSKGVVQFRPKSWWTYHKRRLGELGLSLDRLRLCRAAAGQLADLLFNPKHTLEIVIRRIRKRQMSHVSNMAQTIRP